VQNATSIQQTMYAMAYSLPALSNRRPNAGAQGTRARRQLSLEAVGYLAGLDPATVSRVERGLVEPTPRTVVALARALGVSVGRMRQVLVESLEEAVTGEPRP
jgi:transcriptional regulator with XRE-family HTH domain